jgi:hydrogenase nickel incorporation protein HypA/HybF
MHELSIALSIVEIASEEAGRQAGARVGAVHLKVGALSGVVRDALLFAWDLACDGTPLAGSTLAIADVPAAVWCPVCASEQVLAGAFEMRCPACGGSVTELRRGRELEVTALEMEDGWQGDSPSG